MHKLSVTHISTPDIKGGAARASFRQHQGLLAAGVDSRIFTLIKQFDDDTIIPFDYNANLFQRVVRRLRKTLIDREFDRYRETRPGGLELFSDDRVHLGRHVFEQIPRTDLVNLQWYMGFLDFSLLQEISESRPVIITLHDLWAFTGGCHYDLGCNNYETTCGHCPQLGSTNSGDLSCLILARKSSVLDKCNPDKIVFVAPSTWLQHKALSSSLLQRFTVELIPHGIDPVKFQPLQTSDVRSNLGFSETDTVILFVASGSGLPRKGYSFLKRALEDLHPDSGVMLLTVGGGLPESPHGLRHLHIDHVSDEQELSSIYNAADVLVMPSTHEAYGLTALEAMSCGTPVIGFRMGMCVDAIIEGENGYLVDIGDTRGLKEAIIKLASDPKNAKSMGKAARLYIENNLTIEMNSSRYVKLYETMLDKFQNPEHATN